MTYVVTENCIRCKYTDCVDVCPVDCFREGPNFLVIDPDECIDCTLCVAECPAEAIFAEDDVPSDQQAFADQLNDRLPRRDARYPIQLRERGLSRDPIALQVGARRDGVAQLLRQLPVQRNRAVPIQERPNGSWRLSSTRLVGGARPPGSTRRPGRARCTHARACLAFRPQFAFIRPGVPGC